MRRILFLSLAAVAIAAPPKGLPVRNDPGAYAAQGEDKGVVVAAEVMDPDRVRHTFATDLRNYIVMEVAVWPAAGKPLEVSSIDFSLRTSASRSMVRPAAPRSIAAINQKRSQSRRDDIALYPSVGVSTGSWGTGTSVGVGVGVGGNNPGPASTEKDRVTMQTELEDRGLPESTVTQPVAGYLYFPAPAKRRSDAYDLEYQMGGVRVRVKVPASN